MAILTSSDDDELLHLLPDRKVSAREVFGVDSEMMVPAFSVRDSHVPDFDDALLLLIRNDARHLRRSRLRPAG